MYALYVRIQTYPLPTVYSRWEIVVLQTRRQGKYDLSKLVGK